MGFPFLTRIVYFEALGRKWKEIIKARLIKTFFFSYRRVHVSSRTLSFLDDQFEVEAAHGEKREQILRTAGLETYFILRARNPPAVSFDSERKRSLY